MTHSEIYRIILDCLGTPRTTIDELGYDALCEKIEGIMGNNQVVPSNLPSKDEFLSKAKDDYCRGTGFNCTIENLYNWLVSKLPASNNSKEINELKNEAAEPASEDYIEKPFDLDTAKWHPEWVYTKNGDKVEELVKFNTARHDYQYACTIDGVLETFRSGNDFVLRIPKPKKVKKWIATYVVEGERVAGVILCSNFETVKGYYGPTYTDVQYHEIEVEEEL